MIDRDPRSRGNVENSLAFEMALYSRSSLFPAESRAEATTAAAGRHVLPLIRPSEEKEASEIRRSLGERSSEGTIL
jgi:hypothetical protein